LDFGTIAVGQIKNWILQVIAAWAGCAIGHWYKRQGLMLSLGGDAVVIK
jgi:hypothetical protein